jgi:uncharacterized protein (TIGR03435 family)
MNLLATAFAVKEHQISGPDWLRNERFDVTAKLPEGATKDQVPAMLQTLLAERFKLTTHKDSKTLPVYALIVAKNGPKLHAAEGEGGMRMMMGPKGRQMTGKAPIGRLADMLSNMLDRPVIDLTEIKGTYDIDLLWSPDGSEGGGGKMGMRVEGGPRHDGGGIEPKIEGEADAPSIFTALQEKLGLKLDARKSPVDIITVDTLEKIPTENSNKKRRNFVYLSTHSCREHGCEFVAISVSFFSLAPPASRLQRRNTTVRSDSAASVFPVLPSPRLRVTKKWSPSPISRGLIHSPIWPMASGLSRSKCSVSPR